MEEADTITKRRLEVWAHYHQWFVALRTQERFAGRSCRGVHSQCTYVLPAIAEPREANELHRSSEGEGDSAVFHYVPLHSAPMGQKIGRVVGDMSNTANLSERLVRLPLWLGLEDQLAFVIQEVIGAAS